MTDQDNPNPPSSSRRGKSKQIVLHVIKARVTTVERDQIEATLADRNMTMSELIRAGVLGGPTKAPEDCPAANIPDLDIRIERLDRIASTLSRAASALQKAEIVTPAIQETPVSTTNDAPSDLPIPASGNRRIAGSKNAAGVIPAMRISNLRLTREELIVGMAMISLLVFYVWTKSLN